MKKQNKIVIILLLSLTILLIIFGYLLIIVGYKNNNSNTFTLEEIKDNYQITQPIDDPREVIEILKQNNQINYTYLDKIESDVGREINWKFYVRKNESIWKVNLQTDGLIPPHSCLYKMTIDGKAINNKYLIECYWMK